MAPHCTYCGETVPDDEYEKHLEQTHGGELTAIDQRRLGPTSGEPKTRNLALYAGVGVVVTVFVLGYGILFLGSGDDASPAAVQPDVANQIHEHGTITVEHDGTAVDFNQPQFIERDGCFHFHAYDDAQVWHAHCEDVTIEYALETLGIGVTAERFSIDDQEYAEEDGDDVSVTVDGEDVDPQEYVLEGTESVEEAANGAGDNVEIVVESGA